MRVTAKIPALAVTLLVPLLALAAASSQQVLQEALQARPNLARGAADFETCAACHGTGGAGTADGDIPRIGGQHFSVIVKQLVAFQFGSRQDERMSHFADQHHLTSPQQIADVAGYASQLEPIPPVKVGQGPGDALPHGQSVYSEQCASCHGPAADGNAKNHVPRMAGQHYEYLRRQMYNAIDGVRPGFPAAHVRLLAQLQHDDIAAVADYLSRLTPKPRAARSSQGRDAGTGVPP
jgi:cytochrome c553